MVKAGYKQTEVGVIPDDWDVRPLLSTVRIANGQVDPKNAPYRTMILVAPDHIESGTGRLLDKKTAEQQCAISGKYVFETGDIVYSKIRPYLRKAILASFEGLCSADMYPLKPAHDVSAGYVLAVILGHRFSKYAESVSVRSGMPKINRVEMADFSFPLPSSLPEQRAIAEALSDVDGLIESLEQLIAKKRNLKQGAMQELLTGKKRLPGFSGKWEVKRLDEITDSLDNLRVPLNEAQREKMKGDYPYCGANGVLGFVDNYVIDDDIILMAEDGGYFDEYETRPIAYRMTGKCWVNNHAHILKSKPGFDQGFLFYSLVHKNILSFLASGTRAKLNKSEMNKIEVLLPKEQPEQTAIAAILSDMDADIQGLETKLTKTRLLKQGMMQELLTGRIRLV